MAGRHVRALTFLHVHGKIKALAAIQVLQSDVQCMREVQEDKHLFARAWVVTNWITSSVMSRVMGEPLETILQQFSKQGGTDRLTETCDADLQWSSLPSMTGWALFRFLKNVILEMRNENVTVP